MSKRPPKFDLEKDVSEQDEELEISEFSSDEDEEMRACYSCGELYDLREDDSELQYVVLRSEGFDRVAAYYKEKHGVNILPHCYSSEDGLLKNILSRNEVVELKAGEFLGVACAMFYEGKKPELCHAVPIIIYRNVDHTLDIINFRDQYEVGLKTDMAEGVDGVRMKSETETYRRAQSDRYSCSILTMNSLKHYLKNPEGLRSFLSGESPDLPHPNLGVYQHRAEFTSPAGLTPPKQSVFVMPSPQKHEAPINMKLWEKGHRLALALLDSDHLSHVNEETQTLYLAMSERRQQEKDSRTPNRMASCVPEERLDGAKRRRLEEGDDAGAAVEGATVFQVDTTSMLTHSRND